MSRPTHFEGPRHLAREVSEGPRPNLSGTDARSSLAAASPVHTWYRGVMPSWDNTARRGASAHILVKSSPESLSDSGCGRQSSSRSFARPAQAPLVFINAWNEWGEGTHLEPDAKYGRQWLEATSGAH